jgi:6-phosphogluconate dehydrogenase
MQLGVIGLGRMGANIARRVHRAGHHCVVYNRTAKPVAGLAAEGLTPASDILDLVKKLDPPRAVWIMLPAGAVTEGMIDAMRGRSRPYRLGHAWPRPSAGQPWTTRSAGYR